MTAALAWGATATIVVFIQLGMLLAARADVRRAREGQRTAEIKIIEMAMAHAEEVAKLYERVFDRERIDTSKIVESAVRLATTGSAAPPSALVQSPEPDAEQLLRSRVVEETIANGMANLREEYRRAGVPAPDDAVLREEVELLLGGSLPESAMAGAVRS